MLVLVSFLLAPPAIGQNPAASKQDTAANVEIVKLENQIWEFWKTQKYDTMKTLIAEDAIMVGNEGFENRDQMVEANKREACVVKSVSLQNVKVTMIGQDVAIITYKAVADATCGGKSLSPTGDMNTSVWAKRGGKWLTVVHHQSPASK
jgi:hypothetical protein